MSDEAEFDADAEDAMDAAAKLIVKHYGERCEFPIDSCPTCRAWKLFDKLFENPYKD